MTYPPGSYRQPPQDYKQGIDWKLWGFLIAVVIFAVIFIGGLWWYGNKTGSSSVSQPAQQVEEAPPAEATESPDNTQAGEGVPTGGGIGLGTGGN